MSAEKKPSADSVRTRNRATALAWTRGCEEWNDCWWDCYQCALDAIMEGRLDDWDRSAATPSTYWHLTHKVVS